MTSLPKIRPRGPITEQLSQMQQALKRLQPSSSSGTRTSVTTLGTKRESASSRRSEQSTNIIARWA